MSLIDSGTDSTEASRITRTTEVTEATGTTGATAATTSPGVTTAGGLSAATADGASTKASPTVDVIELRVHGVSGTPPEELLDRGEVYRLAGDTTAGFYRPRLDAERTDGTWAPLLAGSRTGPQLEGYAWGGLTSGAPSRAFWLLLLPFTLVNVAPRMRPPIPSRRGDRPDPLVRATWYLSRLLGLILTVLLVIAAAGIGDDLIGWQCGQGMRCAQTNPQWFARLVFGASRGGINHQGLSVDHRLALGTLAPLVVVGMLWLISRETINRYELVTPKVGRLAPPPDDHGVGGEVDLSSAWMWQNTALVQRLGAVHIQAGLATALWTIAGPLEPNWRIHQHPWIRGVGGEFVHHPLGLIPAIVIAYAIVVPALPSFSRHDYAGGWHNASRVIWTVLALAWAVVAVRLLFAHTPFGRSLFGGGVRKSYLTADGSTIHGLPGFTASLLGLFLFEIAVVVLLGLVIVLAHRRQHRHHSPMTKGNAPAGARGYGAFLIATTGVFLAAVFSAGAYLFTAAWLQTGSLKPSFHDMSQVPTHFHLPEVITLATLAYTLGVIWLAVVAVFAVAWFASAARFHWHGLVDPTEFDADYPGLDAADPLVARRRREILQAFFIGRIVDRADRALALLVVVGAGISAGFSVILFGEHVGHWGWAQRSARWLTDTRTSTHASFRSSIPGLEVVGAYLTVLTLLLMVSLGGLAFRVKATRRSVGILWDIASFWPRTAHPLAAPCYAERTVPDLMTRIGYYRHPGAPDHPRAQGVVLAGHSQGTVISAAALMQLAERAPQPARPGSSGPDDVLAGVSFVTFGCVLRRLYGRYFPVYFGAPAFDRLGRHLGGTVEKPGRWLNLWRYTDYLGGTVTVGPPPKKAPHAVREREAPPSPILEEHLRDPAYFAPQPGDTVPGPPLRHSDFWKSPDGTFQTAVHDLSRQIQASLMLDPDDPPPGPDHPATGSDSRSTAGPASSPRVDDACENAGRSADGRDGDALSADPRSGDARSGDGRSPDARSGDGRFLDSGRQRSDAGS